MFAEFPSSTDDDAVSPVTLAKSLHSNAESFDEDAPAIVTESLKKEAQFNTRPTEIIAAFANSTDDDKSLAESFNLNVEPFDEDASATSATSAESLMGVFDGFLSSTDDTSSLVTASSGILAEFPNQADGVTASSGVLVESLGLNVEPLDKAASAESLKNATQSNIASPGMLAGSANSTDDTSSLVTASSGKFARSPNLANDDTSSLVTLAESHSSNLEPVEKAACAECLKEVAHLDTVSSGIIAGSPNSAVDETTLPVTLVESLKFNVKPLDEAAPSTLAESLTRAAQFNIASQEIIAGSTDSIDDDMSSLVMAPSVIFTEYSNSANDDTASLATLTDLQNSNDKPLDEVALATWAESLKEAPQFYKTSPDSPEMFADFPSSTEDDAISLGSLDKLFNTNVEPKAELATSAEMSSSGTFGGSPNSADDNIAGSEVLHPNIEPFQISASDVMTESDLSTGNLFGMVAPDTSGEYLKSVVQFDIDIVPGFIDDKALLIASASTLNPNAEPFVLTASDLSVIYLNQSTDFNMASPYDSSESLNRTAQFDMGPTDVLPRSLDSSDRPFGVTSQVKWTGSLNPNAEPFIMAAPETLNESLDSTFDPLDIVAPVISSEPFNRTAKFNMASPGILSGSLNSADEPIGTSSQVRYAGTLNPNAKPFVIRAPETLHESLDSTGDPFDIAAPTKLSSAHGNFSITSQVEWTGSLNPNAKPFDIAAPDSWTESQNSTSQSYDVISPAISTKSLNSSGFSDVTIPVLSARSIHSIGGELKLVPPGSHNSNNGSYDVVAPATSNESIYSIGGLFNMDVPATSADDNMASLVTLENSLSSNFEPFDITVSTMSDRSCNLSGCHNMAPLNSEADSSTPMSVEPTGTIYSNTGYLDSSNAENSSTMDESDEHPTVNADFPEGTKIQSLTHSNSKDFSLWRNWQPNKRLSSSSPMPHTEEPSRCVYTLSEMMRIGDLAYHHHENDCTENQEMVDKLKKFDIYRNPREVLRDVVQQNPAQQ